MGGSHGGFLTGWLISQPRPQERSWKGGCMINAVTDMSQMVSITDIQDWVYVESGLPLYSTSDTSLHTMWSKSPISQVKEVKCEVMVVVGASDKRVPSTQSYAYYQALKREGKKVSMYKYPNAGHAISDLEQEADYLIHSFLFFQSQWNNKA